MSPGTPAEDTPIEEPQVAGSPVAPTAEAPDQTEVPAPAPEGEPSQDGGVLVEGPWPPIDAQDVQDKLDRVTTEIERPGSTRENAIRVANLSGQLEVSESIGGQFVQGRMAEWNGMSLADQRSKLRLDRSLPGKIVAFLAGSCLATKLPYIWGDIQETMYATLLYAGMVQFKLDEVPEAEWTALRDELTQDGQAPTEEALRFAMNEKMIQEGPYASDAEREYIAGVLIFICEWFGKADSKLLLLLQMFKPVIAGKAYSRDVATESRNIRHNPSEEYDQVRQEIAAKDAAEAQQKLDPPQPIVGEESA